MGQALSLLYTHLVFSTKDRYPFINKTIRSRLHRYIGGICNELQCVPVQIGGTDDHVHILCIVSRTIAVSDLIRTLKSRSTSWIKTEYPNMTQFYWQSGFGAFSVSPLEEEAVVDYIARQAEHHQKRTFKEEFMLFIQKYGIEYDERFIWE